MSQVPKLSGGDFLKLEQVRIEKVAQDAGFDISPTQEGDLLVFRSTLLTGRVGVAVKHPGVYRVVMSNESVGSKAAKDCGYITAQADSPWSVHLDSVQGFEVLHRLLIRVVALGNVMGEAPAAIFRARTSSLPASTEAERLVVQRVGQGIFRQALIDYWQGRCAVTGLDVVPLLRASHIKPWADCASDAERLDVFNGLLLAPHLDALFDGGWMTFLDSGEIQISERLDADHRALLGFSGAEVISGLTEQHWAYLVWHREYCFC